MEQNLTSSINKQSQLSCRHEEKEEKKREQLILHGPKVWDFHTGRHILRSSEEKEVHYKDSVTGGQITRPPTVWQPFHTWLTSVIGKHMLILMSNYRTRCPLKWRDWVCVALGRQREALTRACASTPSWLLSITFLIMQRESKTLSVWKRSLQIVFARWRFHLRRCDADGAPGIFIDEVWVFFDFVMVEVGRHVSEDVRKAPEGGTWMGNW